MRRISEAQSIGGTGLTPKVGLSYTLIRVAPMRHARPPCEAYGVEFRKDAVMNHRNTLLAVGLAIGSVAASVATTAAADVYVRVAPPAPRYEVVPTVQPGWVWAPGYWNWSGRNYVWVSGHRVRARGHGRWVADRWVQEHGRWRHQHGHWDNRR